MINGAHVIVYSKKPDADRDFFRDVLEFPHVDVGGGWLIFGLPPSEAAVHPGKNDAHEFYLMCDDVKKLAARMKAKKVKHTAIHEERWGSLLHITLPGGGKLGIYQPKHARPPSGARAAKKKTKR